METCQIRSVFPATRWTSILKVSSGEDKGSAEQALAELCNNYWYPLYAFARRLGHSSHDSQDLTQGFFFSILQKELFASANPQLGKLRTFLLTTFRRYVNDVDKLKHSLKRGGYQEILSLDVEIGEERYAGEPVDADTPETLFERSWALSILRAALRELGAGETEAGRGAQFKVLAPFLSPNGDEEETYEGAAAALATSEEATRQAVSRLRKKFRLCLRQQITETLHEPTEEQVDSELRFLREALR